MNKSGVIFKKKGLVNGFTFKVILMTCAKKYNVTKKS